MQPSYQNGPTMTPFALACMISNEKVVEKLLTVRIKDEGGSDISLLDHHMKTDMVRL